MIDKKYLTNECEKFGIELTSSQLDKFDVYAEQLVSWNQKMNLTSITEPRDIVIKHFLDSLLLLKTIEIQKSDSLVDVGTGAGFPSVPVKIMREDINLTLLDSQQKRLNFLQELCTRIGLKCTYAHDRAEDGGKRKELREKFDFSTARAVAHMRDLAEYCIPYLKVGGVFIALKGYDVEDELIESKNAISTMGGKIVDVKKFILAEDTRRSIVLIEKISQTPAQFPRSAVKMAKKPIIAVVNPSTHSKSVNGK